MAEVDGGASVLGNNPLARLHPRPREEKYPLEGSGEWRRDSRERESKQKREQEGKIRGPSTRCCPGRELRKVRRNLLENVWIDRPIGR